MKPELAGKRPSDLKASNCAGMALCVTVDVSGVDELADDVSPIKCALSVIVLETLDAIAPAILRQKRAH